MIASIYSKRIEKLEAAHPPTDQLTVIEMVSVEAVQTEDGMREGKKETAAYLVLGGEQIFRSNYESNELFFQAADQEHVRVHGTPIPNALKDHENEAA